jgi:hypothetical protein
LFLNAPSRLTVFFCAPYSNGLRDGRRIHAVFRVINPLFFAKIKPIRCRFAAALFLFAYLRRANGCIARACNARVMLYIQR